ncbi:Response regulator [uncultured Gammaproteobacteria bacterium]
MTDQPTMLIVDDAKLARMMVRSFVNKARPEFSIIEAGDGDEALRLLEKVTVLEFATIDYNMPGINGIELAQRVRARYPDARIALLTANVQAALRQRAAESKIDFIAKPVTEAKITTFIRPHPHAHPYPH